MQAIARRIGILAGGGTLPREFADAAAASGAIVQIVAFQESADADFRGFPVVRASMGQVGRIIRGFRAAGVEDIVIIGPVRRADIARIRPDSGFFLNLPAILKIIASGGDDNALSGVVRFFEAKGFRVLGPADVAPEVLAREGALTRASPAATDSTDAALGFRLIRALGPFDIGQAAIVTGGRIEAIEGAEGTNEMLERVGAARELTRPIRGANHERAGILVKCPKPGQELRVDMPSIGPGTISRATNAALRGIVVHAGDVLIAERDEVRRLADAAVLFVAGATDGDDVDDADAQSAQSKSLSCGELRTTGICRPRAREQSDIIKGFAVMDRLKSFECGGVVVVARGHVLAVEAGGEPGSEIMDRVETYRKRHGAKFLRRSGVAVFKCAGLLDFAMLEHARAAGLNGIAVAGGGKIAFPDHVVKAADKLGMFLLVCGDTGTRGR